MSLNSCPFCEHGNPEDAKFCNACGGALHLVPCPRCGAVSDVTATKCYQCHSQLAGRKTEALDIAPRTAETSSPLPRRRSRVIAGAAVLAAIAVLGYFGYRQRLLIDATPPVAASWEAGGYGNVAGTGITRRDAAPLDAAPLKDDDSVLLARPAVVLPVAPLAAPRRAALVEPTPGRKIVESREARASAAPAGDSAANARGRVTQERPFRPVECTESIAALGLCNPDSVNRMDAVTAVTIKKSIADSRDTGVSKAGEQQTARHEACTSPVAALGLCTQIPTQRKE